MRIGIIGLTLSGKRTFFQLLTGQRAPRQGYSHFEDIKIGKAVIRDPQLESIADIFRATKISPAGFEVVLFPSIDCESLAKIDLSRVFESCDLFCHVVRCFKGEAASGSLMQMNPALDIDQMFEMMMSLDYKTIQQKKAALEKPKAFSSGRPDKVFLTRLNKILQNKEPLVYKSFKPKEDEVIRRLNCITRKPVVLILNTDDDEPLDKKILTRIKRKYESQSVKVLETSLRTEAELSLIEDNQRENFLHDLSIEESAPVRLLRTCFSVLKLKSFLTFHQSEIRVWIEHEGFRVKDVTKIFGPGSLDGKVKTEVVPLKRVFSSFQGDFPHKLWEMKQQDYRIKDGDIIRVHF